MGVMSQASATQTMSPPETLTSTGLRGVIYARISEDRFDEAEGVERQIEDCRKLAAARGVEVVAVYTDNDRSAMKGPRPDYDRMMQFVQSGGTDVILAKRTDRVYRRLTELVTLTDVLKRANVPVWSVSSGDVDLATADGRLHANLLGSVAQHESEVKAERVRDSAIQRASKGRFSGGQRRFGYQHSSTRLKVVHRNGESIERHLPSGELVLIPAEAEAIEWAYRHVAQGGSLEAVVREWKSRGLVGPQGAKFTGVAVRDVLLRPMNGGLRSYKGTILPGQTEAPAIIDSDTWHAVVAILTDPARRTTVGRPATTLLAPVLRCAICEGRMSGKSRGHGKDRGPKELIYMCRTGHVSRLRHKLDAEVGEIVVQYLQANAATLRRPSAASATIAKASKEAEALRERIAGYPAIADTLDPIDFAAAVNTTRAKLAAITKNTVATSGIPVTSAMVHADDIAGEWAASDVERKRAVIKENVARIEVGPGISGRRDATMLGVRVIGHDGTVIYG
jgi:site-specific DNA recombinase